ncbi:hypothetical protein [Xanthomonas vasicola]|uniref:hypothetical protein n=1 Tax=Xanthomonas vasicola TaxID=56459 RepID=UPI0016048AD6|nr:hypothetical protein [Xanthomonas vasicola]
MKMLWLRDCRFTATHCMPIEGTPAWPGVVVMGAEKQMTDLLTGFTFHRHLCSEHRHLRDLSGSSLLFGVFQIDT